MFPVAGTPNPSGWRLALLLGWFLGGSWAHASPVDEAEKLLDGLEEGAHDVQLTELPKAVLHARHDVSRYLEQHPDDVKALLVSARLVLLESLLDPQDLDSPRASSAPPTTPPTAAERLQRALAHLEHARTLRPGMAEIHYWEARLHGLQIPYVLGGRFHKRAYNLEAALPAARRAVELAPENLRYRETLALLLVEALRPQEAVQVLRQVPDSDSQVLQLLLDLESVPIPRNAVFLPEDSHEFAERQWLRGRFENHAELRVRVYVMSESAAEYERLCRQTWPHFRLLAPGNGINEANTYRRQSVQMLLLGSAAPRPISELAQLEVAAMDGITLTVVEMIHPPEPERGTTPAGQPLPKGLGDVFSYLYVINDRTLH